MDGEADKANISTVQYSKAQNILRDLDDSDSE